MITKSIVGRFLILAILIVAVGVVAQAALILASGGKKAVRTASAAPASTPGPAAEAASPADPIRVVYPGPLGDTPTPKLADAAPASPLSAPMPTAKLAQAMAVSAAPSAPPAPSVPQPATAPGPASAPSPAPVQNAAVQAPVAPPAQTAAAAPVPAAVPQTAAADAAPAAADAAPAAAQAAPAAAQAAPAPAGVEVASLGGGAPAADPASGNGVNINTASVAALNHLGGGHIGETIAKHRPYRSVEELVRRRVLRRSVYNHIRNEIAAR